MTSIMSAERVKLSEYITHLQGIIEKYGDIPLVDGNAVTASLITKRSDSDIDSIYFGSNELFQASEGLVKPKDKRLDRLEGTYFEDDDVGKYFYFVGGD